MYTEKNWRLISTLKRSSQLQSRFIQVQVVVNLLLHRFECYTSCAVKQTMNWVANESYFVITFLSQRRVYVIVRAYLPGLYPKYTK